MEMKGTTRKSLWATALVLVMLSLVVLPLTAAGTPTWWTGWYDRDNPSGTGDWETRADHGNVCLGDTVIGIEGKTLSGTPAHQTGESLYHYSAAVGLVCRNADQSDGSCMDYKVRYLCKGYGGP